MKTCAGLYLTREIAATPSDWPLLSVGNVTYRALAYMFPSRSVFGVPHPTASHGHFMKLFGSRTGEGMGPLRTAVKVKVAEAGAGKLTWLGDRKGAD